MKIPLEDNAGDIIGKAQRGLGISDSELAQKAGVAVQDVRDAREARAGASVLEKIAPILRLHGGSLLVLADGAWQPEALELEGMEQFNTPYGDMTVNSYLAWDSSTREAIAFDSGASAAPMLEAIREKQLNTKLILLTHAHPDHIADLQQLRAATGAQVYLSGRESAPGAHPIDEGRKFSVGNLEIESRLTSGHSPGGMTFVIRGLARPVAIVGDSMFAGSMGGGNISYEDALRNNREKILTLPDDTIICPGHGPLTTVRREKKANPFFAATC